MPSNGDEAEALKAQAVAARSYALATARRGAFDQYPDTRSQVYRGVRRDHATNRAVCQTAGPEGVKRNVTTSPSRIS